MDKDKRIRCTCGKLLFGPVTTEAQEELYILKSIAVVQFSKGKINIKCRNCKRWIEGLDQSILQT